MKQSAARIRPLLLLTGAALAVLVLLLWSVGGGEQTARANPELTVGIDLNPSTQGTYEKCLPISGAGVEFDVDIFVLDVADLMAFSADVEYESSVVEVIGVEVEDHFLGDNVYDASSEGPPGYYRAAGVDLDNEGHNGSGVLARLTLLAKNDGFSPFDLDIDPAMYHGVLLQDSASPPNPIGDTNGDTWFDGPFIPEDAQTIIAVGNSGLTDTDTDGVPDVCDNCPNNYNPVQADTDGDGMGDTCDPDDDNDGIPDYASPGPDNCRLVYNPKDFDGDGLDGEDPYDLFDNDDDGLVDEDHEIGQEDFNDDNQGDVCDDTDGDGVMDYPDNCRSYYNPPTEDTNGDTVIDGKDDQTDDMDEDGVGDDCDPDKDGDGYDNGPDNCPDVYNPGQENNIHPANPAGDHCEDLEGGVGDGYADIYDNCPDISNVTQADDDSDGVGNPCDNCDSDHNPGQENNDGDAMGDACDWDDDNDGKCDPGESKPGFCTGSDNCPFTPNANQTDTDGDGEGDACDDDDGLPEVSEPAGCVLDPDCDDDNWSDGPEDPDGLGPIIAGPDNCVLIANPDQADFDLDGQGDVCDADIDGDSVGNGIDLCPFTPLGEVVDATGCSDLQVDGDGDGICNPGMSHSSCTGTDNCPVDPNPFQEDIDGDGLGDVCDVDKDGDGFINDEETARGSLDDNWSSTPEVCDDLVTDEDGDGQFNEGYDYLPLPTGNGDPDCTENVDTDGDTTPNPSDPDDDNDLFNDDKENWTATNSLIGFAYTTTSNDELDDKWPPDGDDTRTVNILDVLKFKPAFNTSAGDMKWRRRYDLDATGIVNILDILKIKPHFNTSCPLP